MGKRERWRRREMTNVMPREAGTPPCGSYAPVSDITSTTASLSICVLMAHRALCLGRAAKSGWTESGRVRVVWGGGEGGGTYGSSFSYSSSIRLEDAGNRRTAAMNSSARTTPWEYHRIASMNQHTMTMATGDIAWHMRHVWAA